MDPTGAPAGKLSDPGTSGLTNEFSTIADQSVDAISNRVLPRQTTSGVTRGTQRFISDDGSYVTVGNIPDTTQFGIAYYDKNGNLIAKSTGLTDYKYDLSTNKNYYQNGALPDGTYGAIYVKTGIDVQDVFG